MAKKKKKIKSKNLANGAMDMLGHTDIADGVWDIFSQTGELGYYLLYKSLNGDDSTPK